MDRIEYTPLNNEEKYHIALMQRIASTVVETPLVLKGGTALLLAYGLDRYSEDLDFDSSKHIQLEGRIDKSIIYPLTLKSIDRVKDTQTVTRYRVRYDSPACKDNTLKIEVSYRDQNLNAGIRQINSIKTYDVAELIRQKLSALENRTTARDLYDVSFLARRYGNYFDATSLTKLEAHFQNINTLETRFKPAFADDILLAGKDLSELLLTTQERVLSLCTISSMQQKISEPGEDKEIVTAVVKSYIEMVCEQTRLTRAMHETMSSDRATHEACSQAALSHFNAMVQFAQKAMQNPAVVTYLQSDQKEYSASIADRSVFSEISGRIKVGKLEQADIQCVLSEIRNAALTASRSQTTSRSRGGRSP